MSAFRPPSTFITLDEKGRALLAGTTTKVVEIVLDHTENGFSPDEIRRQHGNSFSLAQIYAALSYYYEHQAEFDAEIEQEVREVEELRRQAGESPFVKRMRSIGRL
jgi:uncharacterized protein (DUF433 family)